MLDNLYPFIVTFNKSIKLFTMTYEELSNDDLTLIEE